MWRWWRRAEACSHDRVSGAGAKNDYDSPWKEAVEKFLRPFLALCFPTIEAGIDGSQEVVFLDKELQALQYEAEAGRQYVDKLIRITARDGSESRILIHVEVQAQPDPNLPERMFQYHGRLNEIHGRPVVSLAVLADGNPEYRPATYHWSCWGCAVRFDFPTCKLLDLQEERLQRPWDPIARLIQAHRAALRTARDSPQRRMRKLALLRHLEQEEEGELARDEVHQVLRLLDWFLPLSEPEEIKLREQLAELKPEKTMPFVTSFERYARLEGREEGRQEGLRQAVHQVLTTRFGPIQQPMAEALEGCTDTARLQAWLRAASSRSSLSEVAAELAID